MIPVKPVILLNNAPAAIKNLSLFRVSAATQSALLAILINVWAAKVDFCLKKTFVKNAQPNVEDALMGSANLKLRPYALKHALRV